MASQEKCGLPKDVGLDMRISLCGRLRPLTSAKNRDFSEKASEAPNKVAKEWAQHPEFCLEQKSIC